MEVSLQGRDVGNVRLPGALCRSPETIATAGRCNLLAANLALAWQDGHSEHLSSAVPRVAEEMARAYKPILQKGSLGEPRRVSYES